MGLMAGATIAHSIGNTCAILSQVPFHSQNIDSRIALVETKSMLLSCLPSGFYYTERGTAFTVGQLLQISPGACDN